MARVTVEDCIEKVPNRFDLVLLAAHRARSLADGAQPIVPRDKDKNTVLALREIGGGMLSPEDLREEIIQSLQKYVEIDEPDQPPATAGVDQVVDTFNEQQITEEDLLRGILSLTPPDRRNEDI